jgi:imidazolonepropionase-like amidohydrolase
MKATLLCLFICFSMCPSLPAQDEQKVIWAGAMLNVVEGILEKDVLIVVEGKEIIRISPAADREQYDDVLDLSQYTVLPGLIDCHTHLTGNWYMDLEDFDLYTLPAPSYGIIGTVNARQTLEAGFTTVRDVASYFFADVALRDAINKNWIPGPRMLVTGPGLSITGGHGAMGNWVSPAVEVSAHNNLIEADGVDEMRKMTRHLLKYEVDWIKVFATGGFGTHGTVPGAASYTVEEMAVAVDEARKRGISVAAHAHGAEGIRNALLAGVRSIEHGTYLDQGCIDLLKEKQAVLAMDLLATHYDLIETEQDFSDKDIEEQEHQEAYDSLARNFLRAYQAGVKMVFATDAGVYPHGRNAEQFALMKAAGMTEIDALRTATINAAELLSLSEKTGSIEIGKWADIIAVKGNPLEEIELLEEVAFVMKEGKVYKQPGNQENAAAN